MLRTKEIYFVWKPFVGELKDFSIFENCTLPRISNFSIPGPKIWAKKWQKFNFVDIEKKIANFYFLGFAFQFISGLTFLWRANKNDPPDDKKMKDPVLEIKFEKNVLCLSKIYYHTLPFEPCQSSKNIDGFCNLWDCVTKFI